MLRCELNVYATTKAYWTDWLQGAIILWRFDFQEKKCRSILKRSWEYDRDQDTRNRISKEIPGPSLHVFPPNAIIPGNSSLCFDESGDDCLLIIITWPISTTTCMTKLNVHPKDTRKNPSDRTQEEPFHLRICNGHDQYFFFSLLQYPFLPLDWRTHRRHPRMGNATPS